MIVWQTEPPRVRGVVLPGVFRPISDTWLLARAACREPRPEGARVLELCAGPAFAGIAAARTRNGHLTTVDVSRRAAFNAKLNARLNGVRARTLVGHLLDAVPGERFDLIVANPPYVPGPPPPPNGAARAWDADVDGRAVLDEICATAPAHLAPGGVLLLVQNDIVGDDATLDAYRAAGLQADVAACERGPFGPLIAGRRDELVARGLVRPDQHEEDVLVLRAHAVMTSA